jgi:mono/diheme cytochrome c family protein
VRHRTLSLIICGIASVSAAAAARKPVTAERGRAVYTARCADCHGRNFEGVEEAPALTGARFEAKWRGQSAKLYDKIRRSMPQDDPGSLSPVEASDVTALILGANHMTVVPAARPQAETARQIKPIG